MAEISHKRTIWISDIHFLSDHCKAQALEEYLLSRSADTLYLVGDIIDTWYISSGMPPSHQRVLNLILDSTRFKHVIYIDGNHDNSEQYADFLHSYLPIPIVSTAVHHCLDDQRLLVVHGHQFDFTSKLRISRKIILHGMWLTRLISFALHLNLFLLKRRAIQYARLSRYDGIIMGHFHMPRTFLNQYGKYYNDGDWVEHCTALEEDRTGIRLYYHGNPSC